jgi:hypothetical protein
VRGAIKYIQFIEENLLVCVRVKCIHTHSILSLRANSCKIFKLDFLVDAFELCTGYCINVKIFCEQNY